MSQFSVYANPNPATRATMPLLLDIQCDLISELATRVVVPLCAVSAYTGNPVRTLMPIVQVNSKSYVMLTPQLAGISKEQLGKRVAELSDNRGRIIAAVDLLVTGF